MPGFNVTFTIFITLSHPIQNALAKGQCSFKRRTNLSFYIDKCLKGTDRKRVRKIKRFYPKAINITDS